MKNHNRPWCLLNAIYDKDKKWETAKVAAHATFIFYLKC